MSNLARCRRYAIPTGSRETNASMGLRDISVPMAANGIRRSWRNGGIMVVAELLCTVIATRGNRSLRVLNFISLHLFSKTFASANDGDLKTCRENRERKPFPNLTPFGSMQDRHLQRLQVNQIA